MDQRAPHGSGGLSCRVGAQYIPLDHDDRQLPLAEALLQSRLRRLEPPHEIAVAGEPKGLTKGEVGFSGRSSEQRSMLAGAEDAKIGFTLAQRGRNRAELDGFRAG